MPISGNSGVKGNTKCFINTFWVTSVVMCVSLLLILCGDIEVNPGPKGKKVCPNCKPSGLK